MATIPLRDVLTKSINVYRHLALFTQVTGKEVPTPEMARLLNEDPGSLNEDILIDSSLAEFVRQAIAASDIRKYFLRWKRRAALTSAPCPILQEKSLNPIEICDPTSGFTQLYDAGALYEYIVASNKPFCPMTARRFHVVELLRIEMAAAKHSVMQGEGARLIWRRRLRLPKVEFLETLAGRLAAKRQHLRFPQGRVLERFVDDLYEGMKRRLENAAEQEERCEITCEQALNIFREHPGPAFLHYVNSVLINVPRSYLKHLYRKCERLYKLLLPIDYSDPMAKLWQELSLRSLQALLEGRIGRGTIANPIDVDAEFLMDSDNYIADDNEGVSAEVAAEAAAAVPDDAASPIASSSPIAYLPMI